MDNTKKAVIGAISVVLFLILVLVIIVLSKPSKSYRVTHSHDGYGKHSHDVHYDPDMNRYYYDLDCFDAHDVYYVNTSVHATQHSAQSENAYYMYKNVNIGDTKYATKVNSELEAMAMCSKTHSPQGYPCMGYMRVDTTKGSVWYVYDKRKILPDVIMERPQSKNTRYTVYLKSKENIKLLDTNRRLILPVNPNEPMIKNPEPSVVMPQAVEMKCREDFSLKKKCKCEDCKGGIEGCEQNCRC
uniref:Uncharacterized protein n=1 Tax=viral metagenome TaxID=1070528 RepID=A0A6C0CKT5_9ZZZZ